MKTYYEILGISENAELSEIQRAYRRLIKRYHPDKNHSPEAIPLFNEIQKAYEVLKDLCSKQTPKSNPEAYSKKGNDLRVSINVKINEIIRGLKKTIIIKRTAPCKSCNNTGSLDKKRDVCKYCGGSCYQGLSVLLGQKKKCTHCNGTGSVPIGSKCPKCKGAGLFSELIRQEIKLSPITKVVTIPKQGNYFIGASCPGDLIIEINVEEDPIYSIKNLDIFRTIDISPAQAVLGDIFDISFFDKTLTLKIPSGVVNGNTVEHKGLGIKYGNKSGNLHAKINIIIPTILSEDEKILYQKILKLEKEQTWPKVLNF